MAKGRWFPLLAAVTLAGCVTVASVPMATSASDADAKTFRPPEGRADLYVARSNGSAGAAGLFDISVDGKLVGPIAPGTFYLVVLDSGRHEISAATGMNTTRVTLDADAGRNYFYEVTATSGGFTAKPSLGIVLIEEMGKMMVRQAKRAQGASQ